MLTTGELERISSIPRKTDPTDSGTAPAHPGTYRDLMQITVAPINPSLATLYLRGELDCATAERLTATLAEQRSRGCRFLRVDLTGLHFIDCAGLSALVTGHRRALADRGTLVLTGVGPRVARLLALAGLDTVLYIADGISDPIRVRRATPTRRG